MRIFTTLAEVRAAGRELRAARKTLGFVPTMGALHEGHLSLVRAARAGCDAVTVSIFVNPTQFGPNEDFSKYPRTFAADCELLESEGVDWVFAPQVEEIYPPGAITFVEVAGLSDRLDGASRPGHFRGVATVVAKLFNIVAPDKAFFGQKDAAQVAVLRQMVRDLNFNLELIVCPTSRDPDGLAMSSRNRYLSATERQQALALSRALHAAERQAAAGVHDPAVLLAEAHAILDQEPAVRLDYLAAVDPDTLLPASELGNGILLTVAAFVGTTRLIDNVILAGAPPAPEA